jgi:hypothetical protein
MTEWPAWRVGDAGTVAAYVQTGVARALLPGNLNRRLPGPGAGTRLERARTLFEMGAAPLEGVIDHRLLIMW